MTTNFTASNGYSIIRQPDDRLAIFDPHQTIDRGVRASLTEALREYFQHERDRELGRWRDPKAPNFVTYHSDIEYVRVVNESTGTSDKAWRDDPRALSTAKRYFATHPEPKPWHNAKPGEVWVLDIRDELGREEPAIVITEADGSTAFQTGAPSPIDCDHPDIVAGRRIWPDPEEEQ